MADPVGQLQVLAFLVLQRGAQVGRGELQLLNAALLLPQSLLHLLCLSAHPLKPLLQVLDVPSQLHVPSELHFLHRQVELLHAIDDVHDDDNRPILNPNLTSTVIRNEEVDLLHVLEDDLELHRQRLIGVATHQSFQLLPVLHFKSNGLSRAADLDCPFSLEDGPGEFEHASKIL